MSRHQREGTVFYKSFYDAIKNLPDKERLEVLDAIFLYDFDNKNTKLFGISATIFTLIKPQLDANKKRYLSGKKGGRPPKTAGDKALQDNQNITKTKPNNNQNITKTKPNININNNININKNKVIAKMPNPQILELKNYLIEKIGTLDGNQKENSQYCFNLIRKMKKDYPDHDPVASIKLLIDKGLQDEFHSKNLTSFKYLYYHTKQIIGAIIKKKSNYIAV